VSDLVFKWIMITWIFFYEFGKFIY